MSPINTYQLTFMITGHVLKFTEKTTVAYMCSRNNNFSNRSQKGILWVVDPADAAATRRRRRRSTSNRT